MASPTGKNSTRPTINVKDKGARTSDGLAPMRAENFRYAGQIGQCDHDRPAQGRQEIQRHPERKNNETRCQSDASRKSHLKMFGRGFGRTRSSFTDLAAICLGIKDLWNDRLFADSDNIAERPAKKLVPENSAVSREFPNPPG